MFALVSFNSVMDAANVTRRFLTCIGSKGQVSRSPVLFQEDEVSEKAGVITVRIMQLLPKLFRVEIELDCDGTSLKSGIGSVGMIPYRVGRMTVVVASS